VSTAAAADYNNRFAHLFLKFELAGSVAATQQTKMAVWRFKL
jgi:hypothetical protein